MSSDWEEVKRLAADLQKAQLSSTLQRLSERNCVEIITHLIKHKYIEVLFSNDGKEYITPDYLIQEMCGELFVHGGRINMTELSKILRVDLNQIMNYSKEILKRKDVHLVLNQLIDDTYISRIAEEINEKLNQSGKISINDLTMHFDLPAEFLQHQVFTKHLGTLIQGKQDPHDPNLYYTEAFAARAKAKIRGALAALTKPTPITAILNQCGLQDTTFFLLFDQIGAAGSITSKQSTGQYIPHIYSKSQSDWVQNFYRQNRYIEFDALLRLGISDPKNYIKRQLPNEKLTVLNSCVVSQVILDQIDGAIEECIASKTCLDVQTILPSIFNDEDISMIIESVMTPSRKNLTMVLGYCVLSTAYIELLSVPCEGLCEERAKLAVESGTYQQYQAEKQLSSRHGGDNQNENDSKVDKRDERRKKAAGGKSGGGTQGRETKTKSTKKHQRGKQQQHASNDSDDEVSTKKSTNLELITVADIEKIIELQLEEEGIFDLSNEIGIYLQEKLNAKALEIATKLYVSTTQNKASDRRQNHASLQDRLNALLTDVRLFEKGAKLFPSDIQQQLHKYLLKSICTDFVNEIVLYVASEYELNINNVSTPLTHEQRTKIVNDTPADIRSTLQALLKSLSNSSIEEFLEAAEDSLPVCSMILKKVDKKKDRLLVLNHRHSLQQQLEQCNDPALVLHLTTLILFESATQNMLHASGRHVFAIIQFLKQHLNEDDIKQLSHYHDLVTQYLAGSADKEAIGTELNTKISNIINIALSFKKSTSSSNEK